MHLKSIKLAGFKSFVDPTHIPVKTYNNSIVGPNGCGKSNIVDAIRWVVGETSAKQLRGQSMADVIFNGTTERKPVGRAMVELVFDNTSGRLGGEFAKFAEVAVRREVEREGQSNYYLNGTKCRRKDILDLFLGTGLGPRSYGIIEQGMISRLIEAKPEDLRVFLEEAAGISKYKERRRETQNRIKHTQENLDRVNDLCEELERQLKHLQRQANAAEKYKIYKKEEREYKAQLKVLQWQEFQREIKAKASELESELTQYESLQSQLAELENQLETTRVQRDDLSTETQEIQRQYYEQTAEIAKLEQRIKHQQEQTRQWQEQLEKTQLLVEEFSEAARSRESQAQLLRDKLEQMNPELINTQALSQQLHELLQEKEDHLQDWQQRWENFSVSAQEASKQVELDKNNLSHLLNSLTQSEQKVQRLHDENNRIDLSELDAKKAELGQQRDDVNMELELNKIKLDELKSAIADTRDDISAKKTELVASQDKKQTLLGKKASLEALQQAALLDSNENTQSWLKQHQLDTKVRLGQAIKVTDARWENAVETVLSDRFNAVCVNDVTAYLDALSGAKQLDVALVSKGVNGSSTAIDGLVALSDIVECDYPLPAHIANVYLANSLEDAKQKLAALPLHASIMTQEGVWLSTHWVRFAKTQDAKLGTLSRENELKRIAVDLEQLNLTIEQLSSQVSQKELALSEYENQRDQVQVLVNQLQAQLASANSGFDSITRELELKSARRNEIELELEQSTEAILAYEEEIQAKQTNIDVLLSSTQSHDETKQQLLAERETTRQTLYQARDEYARAKQKADSLTVELATCENQLQLIVQQILQDEKQKQHALEREASLNEQLAVDGTPLDSLNEQLQQRLTARQTIESDLHTRNQTIEQLAQSLRQFDQGRHQCTDKIQKQQGHVQQQKMDQQTLLVKQSTITEQLEASGDVIDEVIATMPEEARIGEWMAHIETLEKRISRLGPINLAAIDEYGELSERKVYLDKQQADLFEAIETLERAINKIDRETKEKFKETFELVNEHFKRLFPSVFGGGRAELELMENDLLNAGVMVKAQPPGKRNATIHMLSGGEKALTAIALVFSFFQLNPAPFCILDEVDAPLDDLNVGRYCRLIKEMAKTTQFIVISHNKVTIASADSLIGVTMHEPGVSRMVAVDMEEAMAMADA